MKLPSPGFLLNAFVQVCRRFPGTMLSAVVGVLVVFQLIDQNGHEEERQLERYWMICQLGLPWFTGLVTFAEAKGWSEKRGWLLQLAGLVLLFGYYFLLDTQSASFEYIGLPRYLVLLVTAHLFVSVAPYLDRNLFRYDAAGVRDFWEYNRELFANIVVGAVFTLILYTGLALAILAVEQLFDLEFAFEDRIYGKLFIFLAGIFNTVYFLFHFPGNYRYEAADEGYNFVFKNLCKYILIPIVALYFIILYAYGGKILATWSLPRGWVSSLVLGFSVAGIFTWLLNFYLPEQDGSNWVRAYRRWFWWVLLPLTALLFVAIAKRIGDYGVTEARFLVAHLGVWLAITCLYYLFSKNDNLRFIPVSLAVFALLFAYGPFNAFAVAERSQEKILTGLLQKNGRWEAGRLVKGTTPVPKDELDRIASALEFLESRQALPRKAWLPMPVDSFPASSHAYNNARRIMLWAGIQTGEPGENSDYLSVNATGPLLSGYDVRGFSTFFRIELNRNNDEKPENGYFFRLSADGKRLEWHQAKKGTAVILESFDLQPQMRKWAGRPGGEPVDLNPGEDFFDLGGRKGQLRVFLSDAQIEKDGANLKMVFLNGYLFLREK